MERDGSAEFAVSMAERTCLALSLKLCVYSLHCLPGVWELRVSS